MLIVWDDCLFFWSLIGVYLRLGRLGLGFIRLGVRFGLLT